MFRSSWRAPGAAVSVLFALSACGSADGAEPSLKACSTRFATSVESFNPGAGPDFGQARLPDIVLGPPKGGGSDAGSLDVATLGNGGSITLGFAPNVIVDGPGGDFIVFENAFYVNGESENGTFAELASVEVSEDGSDFQAFPCTAIEPPYGSCAGYHPVYANPDVNAIDANDPAVSGGDAFDLADLGLQRARYVRIVDRADLAMGLSAAFDLDAIAVVHAECR